MTSNVALVAAYCDGECSIVNFLINRSLKKSGLLLPSSSGSIYGFNVGASQTIQQLAVRRGVPLRIHSIIYKLIDELKDELSSKLPPLFSENVLGEKQFLYKLSVTRPVMRFTCGSLVFQAKQRFSPCSTSQWGRRRFLSPVVEFRKVSWTGGSNSG